MTNEEMSRLIARSVGGDLLSLEVLYQELRDPVYAVALAVTRNPSSAYQVTRKTFVQLRTCARCPGMRFGKRWVIRRARSLARALPAASPPPVTAELTMEKYLMRQAFFQLSAGRRQVLLLSVSGVSLLGCAAILRRPHALVRRWYSEAVDCLAHILEHAPKASLSEQPEVQIRKLLKSSLSLLEAPSFECICEDIRKFASDVPAHRTVTARTIGGAAAVLCLLAGVVWAFSAGSQPDPAPVTLEAAELALAEVSSGATEKIDFQQAQNNISGAVLYNVVPSDSSEICLYGQAPLEADLKGIRRAGSENIAPGLAFYLEKHSTLDGFDVVVCGESLSEEERQKLRESSLLALGGGNYYFRLEASQIEYFAEIGLPVELVGGGAPSRPEGVPLNIDDPTAWVLERMQSTEKTRIRYEVSLTASEQEPEPLEELLSRCGIAFEPDDIAVQQGEGEAADRVGYSINLALTNAQINQLARCNAEGKISEDFLDSPELDAEKDYYYTANGDGWVMK